MKGELKNGFKFDVDPTILDDMELIDALAKVQGEDATAISVVVQKIFGEDQRQALYDSVRTENGRVPIQSVVNAVVEIFEALGEVYHIYDYHSVPGRLLGTLVGGLGLNSRIIQRHLGHSAGVDTILLARILDTFNMYLYSYTKDAKSGRNKPASMADIFTGQSEVDTNYETFRSPEEYERRRQEIIRGK